MVIYVDDGLVAGTNKDEIEYFLNKLNAEFKITVTSANSFLGVQVVKRNHGSILIHQESYAREMHDKFETSEAKPVSTLLEMDNHNA